MTIKFKSIDSVPRDGTHVLLRAPSEWGSSKHRLDEGYYDSGYPRAPFRDHGGDSWTDGGCLPTHWAPLSEIILEE